MISKTVLKAGKQGGSQSVSEYVLSAADELDNDAAAYYVSDSQPTAWAGALAAEIGIAGQPVDADDLVMALDGVLPGDSGETAQMRHSGKRRMGYDLTISAPKSVSIAACAWGDDRITAAHDEAVREAIEWAEQHIIYGRRGHGGTERERVSALIATARHVDARPVDGVVAPQMHTHCVIANIGRRADGTLGGVEINFGHRAERIKLMDAIYKASLAAKLRALGIGLRSTPDGFEIASIGDQTIAAWSPRKGQIDAALASAGLSRSGSTHEQRSAANLATRENKDADQSPAELRQQWRDWAQRTGLTPTYYAPQAAPPARDAARTAVDHLSERESVISDDRLRAASILAGCAYHEAGAIEDELSGIDDLIGLAADAHGGRHTTRQAVARETYIYEYAQRGMGRSCALIAQDYRRRAWIEDRERAQGFSYSADQRAALDMLAASRDRVAMAVGSAGAGKTTMMTAIAQAAQVAGYAVTGLAPSHAAAQALRDAVGSGGDVQTVAKWIIDPPPDDGGKPRYIVMDESGMVGSTDMAAVLRTLRSQDRIMLVGDPRQLGPVSAGQPYAELLHRHAHASLTEIRRQSDQAQRDMVAAFASGRADEGAAMLMQHVTESDDYAAMIDQAADAYVSAAATGSTVALASRRATVADLSAAIRTRMQQSGQIGSDATEITTYARVPLTSAQRCRASTYSAGTRLRRVSGKQRGQFGEVGDKPPFTDSDGHTYICVTTPGGEQWLDVAELGEGWEVIDEHRMAVAVGDQLLVQDSMRVQIAGRADELDTIKNGAALVVTAVRGSQIDATMPDGRRVTIDAARPQPIAYGWARTVHRSQGQTVDHAVIVDDGVTGAQLGYVAASRQRESIRVFSTDAESLADRVGEWAERASATGQTARDDDAARRYQRAVAAGENEAAALDQAQTYRPGPRP